MASAASVRAEMIAAEFAGEGAPSAISGAVGGRREEEALLGFRPGEGGAKETELVVNIILLIGLSVKRNLHLFLPFLLIPTLLLCCFLAGAGGAPARTILERQAS